MYLVVAKLESSVLDGADGSSRKAVMMNFQHLPDRSVTDPGARLNRAMSRSSSFRQPQQAP